VHCRVVLRKGLTPGFEASNIVRQYKATETAFVEWVLGNPYSSAVRPDIVMRCNGGLSGLGRHKKSFIIPVKNTPGASRSTKLQRSEGGDNNGEAWDDLHTIAGWPIQCSIGSPTRKKVCVLQPLELVRRR
jgi:hypothetical protein